MSDQIEFKFEIDLKPGGNIETFATLEDLDNWLKVEMEFWVWPDITSKEDNTAHHFIQGKFLNRLRNLEEISINIKNQPNIHQKGVLIGQLKDYYGKNDLIHSSTSQAQFVKSVLTVDPVLAAFILKGFVSGNVPYQFNQGTHPKLFAGISIATQFNHGMIKEDGISERVALENLRSSWKDVLNQSKNILEDTKEKQQVIFLKLETNRGEQQKSFDDWLQKSQDEYNGLVIETKSHFKEIENLYEKALALRAPIQYWTEKAGEHSGWTKKLVWIVLLAFVVVSLVLSFVVHGVMGENTIQTVHLWKLGLIFLIATIGVWAIRILVRLLLSHLHLGSDAQERVTMLQTYLALLKDNELPEDSRKLILQALFRPATTGLIKDDGVPPFMAEWLKKTTGNE